MQKDGEMIWRKVEGEEREDIIESLGAAMRRLYLKFLTMLSQEKGYENMDVFLETKKDFYPEEQEWEEYKEIPDRHAKVSMDFMSSLKGDNVYTFISYEDLYENVKEWSEDYKEDHPDKAHAVDELMPKVKEALGIK